MKRRSIVLALVSLAVQYEAALSEASEPPPTPTKPIAPPILGSSGRTYVLPPSPLPWWCVEPPKLLPTSSASDFTTEAASIPKTSEKLGGWYADPPQFISTPEDAAISGLRRIEAELGNVIGSEGKPLVVTVLPQQLGAASQDAINCVQKMESDLRRLAGLEEKPMVLTPTVTPRQEVSSPPQSSRVPPPPRIMARVNRKPISTEDIEQAQPFLIHLRCSAGSAAGKRYKELSDATLEQLIDRELLYQDAMSKLGATNPKAIKNLKEIQKKDFEKRIREIKATNHWTDEEFIQNLSRSGLTLKRMEQVEQHRFFADEYLRARVWTIIENRTTYPYIVEYYERHSSEFQQPDSIDWDDVFIAVGTKVNSSWENARHSAEEAARRLGKGEDVLRLTHLDDGDSKTRQGAGYGHEKGEINPPELAEQLFKMKAGREWRIVKISTGYHVVRVTRRVHAGQAPLNNETRELIAGKLQHSVWERESKRIIGELRAKATIELVQDTASNTR